MRISKRQLQKYISRVRFCLLATLFVNSLLYLEISTCSDITPSSKENQDHLISNTDVSAYTSCTRKEIDLENSLNSFYDNDSVNVEYLGQPFDSYILFSIEKRDLSISRGVSHMIAITDMNGTIIAKREIDSVQLDLMNLGLSSCSAEMINSTTVLYGDPLATLWNFKTNVTKTLEFYGHHEIEYVSTRDTIFVLEKSYRSLDGHLYTTDLIREYDMNSSLIWSLDSYNFVGVEDHCPFISDYEYSIDITHGNTIFYDEEEDIIYYNSRNLNTFYKLNYTSKEVIWSLGEHGDFTLYDKHGTVMSSLFYHAHAVEKTAENTFILFDNDRHNQTDGNSRTSRIVELFVDDQSMIAYETYTWEAPESYWTGFWGDADLLPNGNFFGTFGTPTHVDSEIGARLVEVNRVGEIVWELNFDWIGQEYSYGIYRAERFRFEPVIFESEDVIVSPIDNVNISWDVSYNFRTRTNVSGAYEIYNNGSLIENGTHTFNHFWQTSTVEIILGNLTLGYHNITLVLSDGEGHFSSSELSINVTNFFIQREGSTEIEIGQDNSLILWSGASVSTLSYEVLVNQTIHLTGLWDGRDEIILDMNLLVPGYHIIKLILLNDSLPFYLDTFGVSIHPLQAPQYISIANNVSLVWNNTDLLSWILYDASPNYVRLYLDDVLQNTFTWINQTQSFEWLIPILDEGTYEIKIHAVDSNQLINESIVPVYIEPPNAVIISSTPPDTLFWGIPTTLDWEIHGGTEYYIYRNNSLILERHIPTIYLSIILDDWWVSDWFPGNYNITLVVEDSGGESTRLILWILVKLEYGDAYVNEYLADHSLFYTNGNAAEGSADGEYATITSSYSNGVLTLDMGNNEEILNKDGDDFWVIANGGSYSVWVGNNLDTFFTLLSYGSGNQSFDLETAGFENARYIRIIYESGSIIELDAIEAINYRILNTEHDPPIINPASDFSVYIDEIPVEFIWVVYDATPWNYSIYFDNVLALSRPWKGAVNISYIFSISDVGVYEIKLVLFDLFGSSAEETFFLEILNMGTDKTSFSSFLVIGFSLISIVLVIRNKKLRRINLLI